VNNFEKHDTAKTLADCHSGYALAKQVLELREENASLYHLIADIRDAAGDAEGRLMQGELVAHIDEMRKNLAEAERQLAMMRGA
jgi:hypothetical protein